MRFTLTVGLILVALFVGINKVYAVPETCTIESISSESNSGKDMHIIMNYVTGTEGRMFLASNERMLLNCGSNSYPGVAIGCQVNWQNTSGTNFTYASTFDRCQKQIAKNLKWFFYAMQMNQPVAVTVGSYNTQALNMCFNKLGCPTSIITYYSFSAPTE